MPEISISGANEITFPYLSTWGWEIAIYLFLGGLVAGLMILGGVLRLLRTNRRSRCLLLGDMLGFPLLSVGMLLLLIDLSNRLNVWRLYTTFQLSSPMSWGSWILLVTMALLAWRLVSRVPEPRDIIILGVHFFAPVVSPEPPSSDTNSKDETDVPNPPAWAALVVVWGERAWQWLFFMAGLAHRFDRVQAVMLLVLGSGVGAYTGILLSSIQALPLWDVAWLAPLFLVSGLASGGALFTVCSEGSEHKRLVRISVLITVAELVVLSGYLLTLRYASEEANRAGSVLVGGWFGVLFWGVVVLAGLLLPGAVEMAEALNHRRHLVPKLLPPALKLLGGATLRFVIVYAGLRGFN